MTVAREIKEERSADDAGNNLREEVRNILTALEADEDIDNLEEEEVTITEEIAEVLEKVRQVTSLQKCTKEELIRGNC